MCWLHQTSGALPQVRMMRECMRAKRPPSAAERNKGRKMRGREEGYPSGRRPDRHFPCTVLGAFNPGWVCFCRVPLLDPVLCACEILYPLPPTSLEDGMTNWNSGAPKSKKEGGHRSRPTPFFLLGSSPRRRPAVGGVRSSMSMRL